MSSRGAQRPCTGSTFFNAFFEGWLARQQAFLDELMRVSDEDEDDNGGDQLVENILSHYGEYYEEKAKLMRENIFLVFCPPWLTSLEKAFLWAAGFKPSLVFRLLETSVFDIVSEQVEQLEELKSYTMWEEKEVAEALATVQERVGSPQLMELARQVGKLVDGELSDFNEAMKDLKQAMTDVVERADRLRRFIALRVVGILSPKQRVKFLIAVAKYQLRVRGWGLQKDNQGESSGSTAS